MLEVDLTLQRKQFHLQTKFAVSSGSVIALFGRSGCGKTTTANLIAGLLKPDSGLIAIGDRVVFDATRTINVPAEQRRIGYVFQDARLFPHMTVTRNLEYGLRRTHNKAFIDMEFVARLLDLQSLLQRYPRQLSGGERQRVAIGRALLSQPSLLLLDEPLSSLDMARRNDVLPYLERLRDSLKLTMLYVSHQFDEVLRLATQAVLMNSGECIAQGTPQELSLQPELRGMLPEEAIGAVIESTVISVDISSGLAQLAIGTGTINVDAAGLQRGQQVRVQLLARDLVLSMDTASRLSIRNKLAGTVVQLNADIGNTMLVRVDVGNVVVMARVTRSAVNDLQLDVGTKLWVLVKAITLRGRVFASKQPQDSSQ